MNDLTFSIEFIANNKKIWVLRCDRKTFDDLESLINFYLVGTSLKDVKKND